MNKNQVKVQARANFIEEQNSNTEMLDPVLLISVPEILGSHQRYAIV